MTYLKYCSEHVFQSYTVNQIFMHFVCFQLAWRVRQGGAACSDDTTFTHLMGFYTSFPETAATCSLETANTAPSLYWVSHTLGDSVVNNPLKFCWVKPLPLIPPHYKLRTICPVNTGDFLNGKRTGVTLFVGDAFELHLSVSGQISQGEKRSADLSHQFYLCYFRKMKEVPRSLILQRLDVSLLF